MIDLTKITEMSAGLALVAGLFTSIHCIGMCGPLACAVTSRSKTREHALLEATAYHTGRVFSYTFIGSLAGLIGKQPLGYFFHSPAAILPWLMIPFLILTAFPNLVKIPRLKFLTMPYYKAKMWAQNKRAGIAGGMLGIISPCLPCTPLYLIFGISLLSGSAITGAKISFCFSLGTIPLLCLAQSSSRYLVQWIPTAWRHRLRVVFLVGISAMLFLRVQSPFTSNDTIQKPTDNSKTLTPADTTKDLPSCCQGDDKK